MDYDFIDSARLAKAPARPSGPIRAQLPHGRDISDIVDVAAKVFGLESSDVRDRTDKSAEIVQVRNCIVVVAKHFGVRMLLVSKEFSGIQVHALNDNVRAWLDPKLSPDLIAARRRRVQKVITKLNDNKLVSSLREQNPRKPTSDLPEPFDDSYASKCAEMKKLRKLGWSVAGLAKRFETDVAGVYRVIGEHG